jgi:hypothetical protein
MKAVPIATIQTIHQLAYDARHEIGDQAYGSWYACGPDLDPAVCCLKACADSGTVRLLPPESEPI